MGISWSIQGLQEAQEANMKLIAAIAPNSGLGRAVQVAGVYLQRFAVSVTHVDTGTLRASHRMKMGADGGDVSAEIYIDPGATNPRSHARAAEYGPAENARGGAHAFYETTYSVGGDRALELAGNELVRIMDG